MERGAYHSNGGRHYFEYQVSFHYKKARQRPRAGVHSLTSLAVLTTVSRHADTSRQGQHNQACARHTATCCGIRGGVSR